MSFTLPPPGTPYVPFTFPMIFEPALPIPSYQTLAEKSLEKYLLPLTLKELRGELKKIATATDKGFFQEISLDTFKTRAKAAIAASKIFLKSINDKGLTSELKKNSAWNEWNANLSWIVRRQQELESNDQEAEEVDSTPWNY